MKWSSVCDLWRHVMLSFCVCCQDTKTETAQDVFARKDLERQRVEVAVLIEELRAQVTEILNVFIVTLMSTVCKLRSHVVYYPRPIVALYSSLCNVLCTVCQWYLFVGCFLTINYFWLVLEVMQNGNFLLQLLDCKIQPPSLEQLQKNRPVERKLK